MGAGTEKSDVLVCGLLFVRPEPAVTLDLYAIRRPVSGESARFCLAVAALAWASVTWLHLRVAPFVHPE